MSLLEVVVTIAVLGVLATVVGLSWREPLRTSGADTVASAVAAARLRALETGRSVTVRIETTEIVHVITATPDGRIRGGEAVGFDALGGRQLQQTRGHLSPGTVESVTKRRDPQE